MNLLKTPTSFNLYSLKIRLWPLLLVFLAALKSSIFAGNLDVKHLKIELQLDWQMKQANGYVDMTLSLTKTSDQITLHAGELTISSVFYDNKSLKFDYIKNGGNDTIKIFLHTKQAANTNFSIRINYHTNHINEIDPSNLSGHDGMGLRFSQPTSNDPLRPQEVYSVAGLNGNKYWFPCNDEVSDLRTTEFITTVENHLTVIGNGDLISKKINDKNTTYHFKANLPHANYLTNFAIGNYIDVPVRYNDITIHNYGVVSDSSYIKASVERVGDMMKYFSQITGLKYPFKSYSQVFVQDLPNWTSGLNVSIVTENMIDDSSTHADYYYLWDQTQAEALAYQWFGCLATLKDVSHSWITKSFTHYFNFLYNEYKNGREEALFYVMKYDHDNYLNDWKSGYRRPLVTSSNDFKPEYYFDNYSYGHGSRVLHMLRKEIGKEKWSLLLKEIFKSKRPLLVDTKSLLQVINKVTGKDMAWFFEQWIYNQGYPLFEISKQYDEGNKSLLLTIKQNVIKDSLFNDRNNTFFKGMIDVAVDGKIHRLWLKNEEINIYKFENVTNISLIEFDPEDTWPKEVTFNKLLDECITQFSDSKYIMSQLVALNGISSKIQDTLTSQEQRAKIKETLLIALKSNKYWRLKQNILFWLRMPLEEGRLVAEPIVKETILEMIKKESSWLKASAIHFLGFTRDSAYYDLYKNLLNDESFRVVNSAAIALGKAKSKNASHTLMQLTKRPSMKSQSLLCALAGFKELGNDQGYEVAYKTLADDRLPRWRLPNFSIWDYRVIAAQYIASTKILKESNDLLMHRSNKSLEENDLSGIFNNLLLLSQLASPESRVIFENLKSRYRNNEKLLAAVQQYENDFNNNLNK